MRQLATVQRIKSLEPIDGADQIEKATVLGWQLVVKKGEFKVGDFCVYCEIDSLLPDNEDFAFLKSVETTALRIKTRRLRGQISQGICFPVSIVQGYGLLPEDLIEGQEVTCAMGITKYEDIIPDCLLGKAKGYMPSHTPKTSIYRIQNMVEALARNVGVECYETEKLDGESVTYFLNNGEFGVCSKEVEFLESDDVLHWKLAKQLKIEEKLRSIGGNWSIQGEMIGEGIKKNKYKIKGHQVRFFNSFEIDKYDFLGRDGFIDLYKTLELQTVPILTQSFHLTNDIQELVKRSVGRSQLYDTKREGNIVTPVVEKIDSIGRFQFKIINPEFLLKHGE